MSIELELLTLADGHVTIILPLPFTLVHPNYV